GHPCLKLMATATFTIRDFHPIDYAHAGRTLKGLFRWEFLTKKPMNGVTLVRDIGVLLVARYSRGRLTSPIGEVSD
ncbi:hypothetical protein, partial [Baia soyae]